MKKFSVLGLLIVSAALVLLLGSCSMVDGSGTSPVLRDASASGILHGSNNYWDATDFLVGEFHASTGELARFDGRGTVTFVDGAGVSRMGVYSMTESAGHKAVVNIRVNGGEDNYTFDLLSGSGEFALTDNAGAECTYTPVEY